MPALFDKFRSRVYKTLRSETGNGLLPVRLAKGAALYANDVVGRPLAPASELDERRELDQKIAEQKREAAEVVGT